MKRRLLLLIGLFAVGVGLVTLIILYRLYNRDRLFRVEGPPRLALAFREKVKNSKYWQSAFRELPFYRLSAAPLLVFQVSCRRSLMSGRSEGAYSPCRAYVSLRMSDASGKTLYQGHGQGSTMGVISVPVGQNAQEAAYESAEGSALNEAAKFSALAFMGQEQPMHALFVRSFSEQITPNTPPGVPVRPDWYGDSPTELCNVLCQAGPVAAEFRPWLVKLLQSPSHGDEARKTLERLDAK